LRKLLVILCAAMGGCQPTFRAVDYPVQPHADWVRSGAAAAPHGRDLPTDAERKAFAEEAGAVTAIRVETAPEDFYGSKLYDGFDLLLEPLDAGDKVVRRLGHVDVTLYTFNAKTYSGKGRRLLEWYVPASRMVKFWQETGVDRGYHMKLAWASRPTVDTVKMEVRFETLDGEVFTRIVTAGSVDQPRYHWLLK
jgi:hypothetical protein